MHLHSHLRSASAIIHLYDGKIPLAAWLKDYFKEHKKFGSKDRKLVADLCYCFFRLGRLFDDQTVEDKMLNAQFLCHTNSPFIKELRPDWFSLHSKPTEEKLRFLHANANELFSFKKEISDEISKNIFIQSHLVQPDLFARVRPGKKIVVVEKLEQASISFLVEEDCLRFANNSKLDDILAIDSEIVIQDKSSQQVLTGLKAFWKQEGFTSWDCCAASGGKTILLHDHYPKAQMTVSDVRESIIRNLRNRLKRAGINNYHAFVTNLSSAQFSLAKKFDLIICDAPCSGSGTWGRTPEQLSFFPAEKIVQYTSLQKSIALNAIKQLKTGGCFLYITCSVFKKENEEVLAFILAQTKLQLIEQRYFKGYLEKADTMFAALFKA